MGEFDEYSSSLIQQRRQLLMRLIECSESQVLLLSNEDENMTSSFDLSVQEWMQCTEQMDNIQNRIDASVIPECLDDSKDLVKFIQKLAQNVEQSKKLLEQSTVHIGTDLKHTKSQRKLMNAYYGTGNTDQIPLYFDQKK